MSFVRSRFDQEIEALCARLDTMGALAETLLKDAVCALTQQDRALAASVPARDDVVDALDREIEAGCLRLITCQQPVACDLRTLSALLKIIADVERIGDQAVNVARAARRMGDEGPAPACPADMERPGDIARALLRHSLRAFACRDAAHAARVIAAGREALDVVAETQQALRSALSENPACAPSVSHLLLVPHYLERVCRHAVNIAEQVTFRETGRRPRPITAAASRPEMSPHKMPAFPDTGHFAAASY